MKLPGFFHRLLRAVYPPKCPFCTKILEQGEGPICRACEDQLPSTEGRRLINLEGVEQCVSPLWYRENARAALLRYKFGRRTVYAAVFSALMAESVRLDLDGEWDVIAWVPLSKKRLGKRGYDQARLLAEGLSKELDCPCVPLLKKRGENTVQSTLKDSSARRANVLGLYEVTDPALCAGIKVLLVDDVVTSGATLSECAVTLLTAGAAEVRAVTLCRAAKP